MADGRWRMAAGRMPVMSDDGIVRLTRRQVREVDRRAIEAYGVPGIVLMENAARAAAFVAHAIAPNPRGPIVILCGGGNNGGDGLAVARHLHNRHAQVEIVLAVDPSKYAGDALTNWRIVERMKINVIPFERAAEYLGQVIDNLLIDALFGTGLTAAPRGDQARIIDSVNAKRLRVLAIDVPSGLDCDTGVPLGPSCIRAEETVTFVAEKAGFANPASQSYTGRVTVADIGCPREIVDEVLREIPADGGGS